MCMYVKWEAVAVGTLLLCEWLHRWKTTEKTLHIGRKTDPWRETLQVVGNTGTKWNCTRSRLWQILGQFQGFLAHFLLKMMLFSEHTSNALSAVLENIGFMPKKLLTKNKHAPSAWRSLIAFCAKSSWQALKSLPSCAFGFFFSHHASCTSSVSSTWRQNNHDYRFWFHRRSDAENAQDNLAEKPLTCRGLYTLCVCFCGVICVFLCFFFFGCELQIFVFVRGSCVAIRGRGWACSGLNCCFSGTNCGSLPASAQ